MDLDRVAVVLRPRSPWEAVDLGAALLRRFWRPIMAAWLFSVVPVCLVVMAFFDDNLFLALAVIWLLKPIFDRVPRFVLARAMFREPPTFLETLRRVPRLWTTNLFHGLIALRLQASRALTAPVSDLEGLRGKARSERARGLRRGVAAAGNAAFLCAMLEVGLTIALVSLVIMVLPEKYQPDLAVWMENGFTPLIVSEWIAWATRISFLVAFSVTGPLHVAVGFALYINRRTELEGWDVELAFRRCAERSRRRTASRLGRVGTLVLAFAALFGGVGISSARAAPSRAPEDVIEEVLEHEEFGKTETVEEWRFKRWGGGEGAFDAAMILAVLLELVGWVALVAVLMFLVYQISRRAGWIRSEAPTDAAATVERPTMLFGLDLRSETLPDDVPTAVLDLWRSGQAAAATGLLYRASIAKLVERSDLVLESSDTERDCLRRVDGVAAHATAVAFGAVTRAWQLCAYSTERPTDAQIQELCADWSSLFRGSVA